MENMAYSTTNLKQRNDLYVAPGSMKSRDIYTCHTHHHPKKKYTLVKYENFVNGSSRKYSSKKTWKDVHLMEQCVIVEAS